MFLCSYVLMSLCSYVLTFFFEFLCSYVCICSLVEKWNRCGIVVSSKWDRSGFEVKPKKNPRTPRFLVGTSKYRNDEQTQRRARKNHQRWWYSRPSNSSLGPVCKKTICDVANPPPIFPHHPDPLMAHRIILSFCIPFVLIIEPGKLYWSSSSPGGPWKIGQW